MLQISERQTWDYKITQITRLLRLQDYSDYKITQITRLLRLQDYSDYKITQITSQRF